MPGLLDDLVPVLPRDAPRHISWRYSAEDFPYEITYGSNSCDTSTADGRLRQQYLKKLEMESLTLRYTPCVFSRAFDMEVRMAPRTADRDILLAICVTLYNEDSEELERTLGGVAANLDHLNAHGVSWDRVVLVIVVDGLQKMNDSVARLASNLKMYNPEMLRSMYFGHDVTSHIFERTVELPRHHTQREYFLPLQTIFMVKAKNGGKLNSHLWFFQGFCQLIQPVYCVTVDVGTVPSPTAIYGLYRAMHTNPQVGGVCGEITVRNPQVFSCVGSAQIFEYKMSHVLDKSMESVFGYISVLPGAFSAYRFMAIRGRPLIKYFAVEEESVRKMGPFLANMYLAEDRILGLEMLAKKNRRWTMHYVAGAVAETDVPQNLLQLIKQRRRWLNGAFFAMVYYLINFGRVLRSTKHSWLRKVSFSIQFAYMVSLLVLSWLAPGSLFLSIYTTLDAAVPVSGSIGTGVLFAFSLIYLFAFMLMVLAAIGNNLEDVQLMYSVISIVYGFIITTAIVLGLFHVITNEFSFLVQIVSGASFLCYIVGACIHNQLFITVAVLVQYTWFLPTLVNILPVYYFCNLHDISWGTKEGNTQNTRARELDRVELLKKAGVIKSAGHAVDDDDDAGDAGAEGDDKDGSVSVLTAVKQKAEMTKESTVMKVGVTNQQALTEEMKEVQSQFKLFRLRLLAMWLACNVALIQAIIQFSLLREFLAVTLTLVLVSLGFRFCGSLMYQTMRFIKWLTRKCCCRPCRCCCCKRFPSDWELHDPEARAEHNRILEDLALERRRKEERKQRRKSTGGAALKDTVSAEVTRTAIMTRTQSMLMEMGVHASLDLDAAMTMPSDPDNMGRVSLNTTTLRQFSGDDSDSYGEVEVVGSGGGIGGIGGGNVRAGAGAGAGAGVGVGTISRNNSSKDLSGRVQTPMVDLRRDVSSGERLATNIHQRDERLPGIQEQQPSGLDRTNTPQVDITEEIQAGQQVSEQVVRRPEGSSLQPVQRDMRAPGAVPTPTRRDGAQPSPAPGVQRTNGQTPYQQALPNNGRGQQPAAAAGGAGAGGAGGAGTGAMTASVAGTESEPEPDTPAGAPPSMWMAAAAHTTPDNARRAVASMPARGADQESAAPSVASAPAMPHSGRAGDAGERKRADSPSAASEMPDRYSGHRHERSRSDGQHGRRGGHDADDRRRRNDRDRGKKTTTTTTTTTVAAAATTASRSEHRVGAVGAVSAATPGSRGGTGEPNFDDIVAADRRAAEARRAAAGQDAPPLSALDFGDSTDEDGDEDDGMNFSRPSSAAPSAHSTNVDAVAVRFSDNAYPTGNNRSAAYAASERKDTLDSMRALPSHDLDATGGSQGGASAVSAASAAAAPAPAATVFELPQDSPTTAGGDDEEEEDMVDFAADLEQGDDVLSTLHDY